MFAPYHPVNNPNGGNYGGDPCYVLVQAGFLSRSQFNVIRSLWDTIMMAPIGDTWVKEEILAWVYGGVQAFVDTKYITDSQLSYSINTIPTILVEIVLMNISLRGRREMFKYISKITINKKVY